MTKSKKIVADRFQGNGGGSKAFMFNETFCSGSYGQPYNVGARISSCPVADTLKVNMCNIERGCDEWPQAYSNPYSWAHCSGDGAPEHGNINFKLTE